MSFGCDVSVIFCLRWTAARGAIRLYRRSIKGTWAMGWCNCMGWYSKYTSGGNDWPIRWEQDDDDLCSAGEMRWWFTMPLPRPLFISLFCGWGCQKAECQVLLIGGYMEEWWVSDTVLSEREFRLRILELRFGEKGICEVQSLVFRFQWRKK